MNENIFKILKTLPNNCKFLQIGVNDGQDHLTAFILSTNWQGTMVEPDPYYILLAKEKYANASNRLTWYQCAISNKNDKATMYKVIDIDREWEKGIGSLDKNHVLKHDIQEENITSFDVDVLTLDKIIKDVCDIWFIDAEGSEESILLGCDITNIKPKYIIIETVHMCQEKLNCIATQLNYTSCWHKEDSILIRNE